MKIYGGIKMAELNFFDVYMLAAIVDEVVPRRTFFKDRYFPTGEGDIFAADEVLTEYRKGDRQMAAFVSERVGDIPIDRRGYEIHAYKPAYIAPSRLLTVDDLKKRGFGEAMYSDLDQAARAVRIIRDDLTDLENRIAAREEWMAAQVIVNNSCTMQTYVDATVKGEVNEIKFYDTKSDHTYTVSKKWNVADHDIRGDVKGMCRMLSSRGLQAADLVVGADVADVIYSDKALREDLNTHSGFMFGTISEQLSKYDGVVFMGRLNFGGYLLNVITADHTYVDEAGHTQTYFPAKSAVVTAPGCGHMMYGQITQIDFGSSEYTQHKGKRIPKLVVDQDADIRKMRLGARPLAAPRNYCPYIYAEVLNGG